MIQKIRKFIVVAIAGLTLMSPAVAAPLIGGIASADIAGQLCTGVNQAAQGQDGTCSTSDSNGTSTIQKLASKAVNIFSVIVGAASVLMIIYGGFRYITSGGDSGKVGNAKNTLIYAIVGLVIVALAQLIVHFVLTQTNGVSGNPDVTT